MKDVLELKEGGLLISKTRSWHLGTASGHSAITISSKSGKWACLEMDYFKGKILSLSSVGLAHRVGLPAPFFSAGFK